MVDGLAVDAYKLFDVTGRRVLVTGAGHGLGLATASAFVGAGALVAGLDIDVSVLEAMGADAGLTAVLSADVDDSASVDTAVAEAVVRMGGLDVVINAAAQYPTGSLINDPPELMEQIFRTNVAGYARVVRAAYPSLAASGSGRVVNFSSVMAFSAYPPNLGAYVVSKAAIIGYTRALAREVGPAGICVNSLAPGSIPTRSTAAAGDTAAWSATVLGLQCVKRLGRVSDIAATALFLSSEAAGFITGQTLLVDGGWMHD